MANWKTTVSGVLAAMGAALQASDDATLRTTGAFLLAIFLAAGFITAADGTKK